jgi:hypothetical protein
MSLSGLSYRICRIRLRIFNLSRDRKEYRDLPDTLERRGRQGRQEQQGLLGPQGPAGKNGAPGIPGGAVIVACEKDGPYWNCLPSTCWCSINCPSGTNLLMTMENHETSPHYYAFGAWESMTQNYDVSDPSYHSIWALCG